MAIEVRCPVCGERFRRPDGLAGKLEKCPECRALLRLPLSTSAEAELQKPASSAEGADTARSKAASKSRARETAPDAPKAEAGDKIPSAKPARPSADETLHATASDIETQELEFELEADSPSVPASPLDVKLAARSIRAGRPNEEVEAELVARGMDQPKAQAMVRFMSNECHHRRQQKLKEKKARLGRLWIRTVIGLLLTIAAVGGLAADALRGAMPDIPAISNEAKYAIYGVGAAGLLLLLTGVRRLMSQPRPPSVRELIAAWRKQEQPSAG